MINNLGERIVSKTLYIKSKLDNQLYCKTNGQFARHLRLHNLTNRKYYETYILGYTPLCYCCKPVTYYRDGKYAKSCGDPCCVGTTIKQVKSAWTNDRKLEDSMNKKKAALLKTPEQKKEALQKAKETFQLKYGVDYSKDQEAHEKMHALYKQKKFDAAAAMCKKLIGNFDGQMDKYYKIWIERCDFMKQQDLPDNRNGEFIAHEK